PARHLARRDRGSGETIGQVPLHSPHRTTREPARATAPPSLPDAPARRVGPSSGGSRAVATHSPSYSQKFVRYCGSSLSSISRLASRFGLVPAPVQFCDPNSTRLLSTMIPLV